MEAALYCPITKCIFLHPVTLPADGHTYERREITKWVQTRHSSPMTRQPVHSIANIHDNIAMQQLVELYLTDHPEKKEDQYVEPVTVLFDPMKFDKIVDFEEQKLYVQTCEDIAALWNIAHLCQSAPLPLLQTIVDAGRWHSPPRINWTLAHYICRWAPNRLDIYFRDQMQVAAGFNDIYPLHLLCSYGQLPEVRFAIEELGADANCADIHGFRPIHLACERDRFIVVQYLTVVANVDVNAASNEGICPIHLACQTDNLRTVRSLISAGANVECETIVGQRPIHIVCEVAKPAVIEYFVKRGVQLNVSTVSGVYPVHYLCRRARETRIDSVIRLALDRGMDMERETGDFVWPIHLLCAYAPVSLLQYLFSKGVHMDRETRLKVRPIHTLCKRCKNYDPALIQLIKQMVSSGAVDVGAPDLSESAPIHYACEYAPPELIHFLIHQPASSVHIDGVDNRGMTPLHYLCYRRESKLIWRLLERGCAIDPVANDGIRPIHILLTNVPMDVDLVCEFIRRGANLHTGPSANMLPLHVLYRSGRFDVLMYAMQKENIRAYVPRVSSEDICMPVDWFMAGESEGGADI